jgi:FkbM family methyltransferase
MHVKTVDARHGRFSYFSEDTFVGQSLDLYGEYSETEVDAVKKLLKPGDVVIEVGSNIGTLTVPMARIIGPKGLLHSYEPQPSTAMLLRENLTNNGIDNVIIHQAAAGNSDDDVKIPTLSELGHNNYGAVIIGDGSITVAMERIDDLKLDRLNLLKIDAEGTERQVLLGAAETIRRCRPIIYVENDRSEKAVDLIGQLVDMGYRLYWHRPYLFNPNNFFKQGSNVFGAIVSVNMLCVPTDVKDDKGYFEVNGLDDVGDLRIGSDMYEREAKRFAIEVEHHPKDLTARLLVAHNRALMGEVDAAQKLIAENLVINATHAPSVHVKGLLDLQAGNYSAGWKGYEARYLIKEEAQLHFGGNRRFAAMPWNGAHTNETLLIWCEQGFGDNIMFVRFMKNVLELAPNAILETQPQLFELFQLSELSPRGLYRRGRTLPPFGIQCSLPSLPYILRLHTEDQLYSPPYLKTDPAMVEIWRKKLERFPIKIGVCYRGSPRSERPWSRDIDPKLIDPMLQKYSPFIDLTQEGQFESFADSAACISALDAVISVDTSVAHLAGALGVPTYLLLSTEADWRWKLNTDRTCWYESVHILRQRKFLDWSHVVEELAILLKSTFAQVIGLRA